LAVGAVWLFLLAIPALADNGPHVKGANAKSLLGSCASCHRAHSGQAPMLLKDTMPNLCYTCHGSASAGSTTNVADGVTATNVAMRGGGFNFALIDTKNTLNSVWTGGGQDSNLHIYALATGQATQSSHSVNGTAVSMWGSGPLAATGPTFTVTTDLTCASCHDPHGNGQYRILKPNPDESPTAPGVYINDVPAAGSFNYATTDYGTAGTANQNESAKNIGTNSAPTAGMPAGSAADSSSLQYVPVLAGKPAYFKGMYVEASSRWCATCHTRYFAPTGSAGNKTWTVAGSIDPVFKFRHATRDLVDPATAFAGSPAATAVLSPLGAGSVLFSQIKPLNYVELDRTTGLPTGWTVTSAPSIGDIAGTSSAPKYEGVAIVTETWNVPGVPYTPPSPLPAAGATKIASALGSATGAPDLLAGSAPRCITCHVSHGSNATDTITAQTSLVTGAALHSPLLRLDGRGVCQNCHKK
jgi:predicted CXXCH cytochrome family protein